MSDTFNPGDKVSCTITGLPRSEAGKKTIGRLMKLDPEIQRGLRKAQTRRRQNMKVYIRGGRDWYAREKCGRGGQVRVGESFTFPYAPQLSGDIKSVEKFLKLETAKS